MEGGGGVEWTKERGELRGDWGGLPEEGRTRRWRGRRRGGGKGDQGRRV